MSIARKKRGPLLRIISHLPNYVGQQRLTLCGMMEAGRTVTAEHPTCPQCSELRTMRIERVAA